VSTVGFVVAGVGAGAGAFGFFMGRRAQAGHGPASSPTSPEAPPGEAAEPAVSLYFGGSSVGLRGTF